MKLLHDLDVICSYPLEPSLESVLHFVVEFQKSLPDLVARAHLQVGYTIFSFGSVHCMSGICYDDFRKGFGNKAFHT